jgi:ABC-type transporter Mla subunit MlaD
VPRCYTHTVAALSEAVRAWLLAPVLAAVEELRVSNTEQNAELRAVVESLKTEVAGVGDQVGQAVAELARLADALDAPDPDVAAVVADLRGVVSTLAAEKDKLDAAVPDAAPPAPPAP